MTDVYKLNTMNHEDYENNLKDKHLYIYTVQVLNHSGTFSADYHLVIP